MKKSTKCTENCISGSWHCSIEEVRSCPRTTPVRTFHKSQSENRKLNELSVEVLSHPPYFPDLSPTDYHLFKHFDIFLTGKTFANQDQAKTAFADFIESRAPNFYADRISQLVLHWQKCTDSNGAYLD